MFVKLVNGQLEYIPNTYAYNGYTYSNYHLLPEETHLSHGWKPFIDTPMPEVREGVGYSPVYTDNDNNITVEWAEYKIEPFIPEVTSEQRIQAIEAALMEMAGELYG